MNQPIIFDDTTTKQIIRQLEQLEELKCHLLTTIPEQALQYGSSLWWEKVELSADQDTKNRHVRHFSSMDALVTDLHT